MELSNEQSVNLKAGKPDSDLTDEQWQLYFAAMKSQVKPKATTCMNTEYTPATVNGKPLKSEYDGDTMYMYYCEFINSVLDVIRGTDDEPPEHDYCYFIYQIAELLTFEHERLRTRYLPEYKCFEVWLHF